MLSWRLPFWLQGPINYSLQCWDECSQTTNRAGKQPHLLVNRLPKVFPRPQQPLNTSLHMALPLRTRPSSNHQGAGTAPPARKAAQASPSVSNISEKIPETRWSTVLQSVGPQIQKVTQKEKVKKYALDEGKRYNPRRTTKWSGNKQFTLNKTFRIMIANMIQDLRKRMEVPTNKIQKSVI